MLKEKLLKIDEESLRVSPTEYSVSLIPFQNILVRHGNILGCKIFGYVYHMRDPKSNYASYGEKERHEQVAKDLFTPKELKELKKDPNIKDALDLYVKHETSTLKLLRSSRESMDKLQNWLNEVDTNDDDYDALKHVKILESMGKVVDSLKKLEEAAKKESEDSSTYGSVELNEWSL